MIFFFFNKELRCFFLVFGCIMQFQPGIEPVSLALQGRLLTTGLPRKSLKSELNTKEKLSALSSP